jgi:hypothetical protein
MEATPHKEVLSCPGRRGIRAVAGWLRVIAGFLWPAPGATGRGGDAPSLKGRRTTPTSRAEGAGAGLTSRTAVGFAPFLRAA